MKKIIYFLFLLFPSLTSCSTLHSNYANKTEEGKFYNEILDDYNSPIKLSYNAQLDINGILPQHVYIKTLTQTFTKDYEFIIYDGKLYYKEKNDLTWELYLKTGLPKGAESISEIYADSNCLFVFDSNGILYRTYTKKESTDKAFTWIYKFGWPEEVVFSQNQTVKNKRGWAMGARRKDMLWYEDKFGNQHHYGTMGLETIYFLTENGQQIKFTDSGLPADYSKTILTPKNGSFIAQNISNSASTIFLIGDSGTMYTKLIDYDTMGCDPMFFKYTYKSYKSKYKGNEYLSNYEPWGLPSEDWLQQPSIPLKNKARLTRFISIHQNGNGNEARILRVAGLNDNGESGFYEKSIFDKNWTFIKTNLYLTESDFLTSGEEWGEPAVHKFSGAVYEKSNKLPISNVTCNVKDFTLANEGSFHIDFTMETPTWSESKTIKFHNVEMWTYMPRINPGYDGLSKYYFITPDFEENDIKAEHKDFEDFLNKLFYGMSKKTFSMQAEATSNFIEIKWTPISNTIIKPISYSIFMTNDGINYNSSAVKTAYSYKNPISEEYFSSEISYEKEIYNKNDEETLKLIIEKNKSYKKFLKGQLAIFNGYKHNTNKSRWEYDFADLLFSVSLLNHIDFPKIKTVTTYCDELMDNNALNYAQNYTNMKITYPHIINLVNNRINKYENISDALEQNDEVKNPDNKVTFIDYFYEAGISDTIYGKTPYLRADSTLNLMTEFSLCRGFLIKTEADELGTPDYFFVELKSLNESIQKDKIYKVILHTTTCNSLLLKLLDNKTCNMVLNNNGITIKKGSWILFVSEQTALTFQSASL